MGGMIKVFNSEVERYRQHKPLSVDDFVIGNEAEISWTQDLKRYLAASAIGKRALPQLMPNCVRVGLYRPFLKQYVYFDGTFY
jgi:predicted helicase